MEIDLQLVCIPVDLHAVAGDTRKELRPLRRWARNRLTNNPACGVARLPEGVVEELAAALGFRVSETVHHLQTFRPQIAPQRP